MGARRGRIAVTLVLAAAATVGAKELLYPNAPDGRLEAARAADALDPDAPIATARYREPTATEMAQVGMTDLSVLASAEPPVVRIGEDQPLSDPTIRQLAQLAPHARVKVQTVIAAQSGSAFQAPDPDALAALSLADGGRANGRPDFTGRSSIGDDAKALLVKISPKADDARRGRWFLFAAASGKAFGLNLVRDSEAGLRRAGWSVERLAVLGKGQVGVGWRKHGLQASLAVAQREVGDLGVKIDDWITGFSLSWRPEERR